MHMLQNTSTYTRIHFQHVQLQAHYKHAKNILYMYTLMLLIWEQPASREILQLEEENKENLCITVLCCTVPDTMGFVVI